MRRNLLSVGGETTEVERPRAPNGADTPRRRVGVTNTGGSFPRFSHIATALAAADGPHNALRSDMAKLLKALEALTATDAPTEIELANLSTWFDSFAHLLHGK